jgi:hypothetical protein
MTVLRMSGPGLWREGAGLPAAKVRASARSRRPAGVAWRDTFAAPGRIEVRGTFLMCRLRRVAQCRGSEVTRYSRHTMGRAAWIEQDSSSRKGQGIPIVK